MRALQRLSATAAALALAAAQFPPGPCDPGDTMALRIVPQAIADEYGAAALDGSNPAYWVLVRNATRGAPWIVSLQGGAWCWTLDGDDSGNPMASCVARAQTNLGSSALLSNTSCAAGIQSANATVNPAFAGYNVALIAYLDGSFHSSLNPAPVPGPNGTQLHFRGRANLRACLEDLIASYGLGDGTQTLIFTGGSAGGQGVYFHADYVAGTVLPRARFPSLSNVLAIADAGMFLDAGDYADGTHQYRGRLSTALPLWQTLAARTLDSDCLDAYNTTEQWRCFFPQYSAAYTSTPLFIVQSVVDAEQLYDDLAVGCCPLVNCANVSIHPGPACNASQLAAIQDYQQQGIAAVQAAVAGRPGVGVFADGCYIHVQTGMTQTWVDYAVDGVALRDAVAAWVAGITGTAPFVPVQLIDDSVFPTPGNPSCPYPGSVPPPPPIPPVTRA